MINKGLILLLIRDSLINYKLVSGLNSLGLDADDYNLFMDEAIFSLMGFEKGELNDKIFEEIYLPLADMVKKINFSRSNDKLDALTLEIYDKLIIAKEQFKKED